MSTDIKNAGNGNINPYRSAVLITPNDSTDLNTIPRAVKIGATGGALKVDMVDGGTVTFTTVAGELLEIQPKRIYATDTVATTITALW